MCYAKRRPVGTPLTWGEAMVAATYVFFLMFWVYGVVPHQLLTWTQNELKWRTDALLIGPGAHPWGRSVLKQSPVIMSKRPSATSSSSASTASSSTGQVALWSIWQNRGKQKASRGRDLPLRPPAGEGLIAMARTDANPPMPEFRGGLRPAGGRRRLPGQGGQAEAVHPHRPVRVHHVRGLRRHLPVEVHPHGPARRPSPRPTAPSVRASTRATTSCS